MTDKGEETSSTDDDMRALTRSVREGFRVATWAQAAFFETISHDEDLVAVLRGHLHIEVIIGDLLALRYPTSTELFEEMSCATKSRLLRRLGMITREHAKAAAGFGVPSE